VVCVIFAKKALTDSIGGHRCASPTRWSVETSGLERIWVGR